MKPLGQKPHRRNFEDCHPPKGLVNWWSKGWYEYAMEVKIPLIQRGAS